MADGNDVVAEARRWIGVPFFHTGRNRNGVDCCGLVICVFNEVYKMSYDNRDYSPVAPVGLMRSELEKFCDYIPDGEDMSPGDVMLFSMLGHEQHVGIYNGAGGMIHAYQSVNAVSEHHISNSWRGRICARFRYRGR